MNFTTNKDIERFYMRMRSENLPLLDHFVYKCPVLAGQLGHIGGELGMALVSPTPEEEEFLDYINGYGNYKIEYNYINYLGKGITVEYLGDI